MEVEKSVGAWAEELQKTYYNQQVGETLEGMAPEYDKWLRQTLETNKSLDHYYIVVLRKKDPLLVNALRQWFIAPRRTKPSARVLRKDYPLYDHDIWEVTKGDPRHLWTLPAPDGLNNILSHPEQHDPQLVGWIREYLSGQLE